MSSNEAEDFVPDYGTTTDKMYSWEPIWGVTCGQGELHVGYVIDVKSAKGKVTRHEVVSLTPYRTRRGTVRVRALLSEEI